MMVRAVLLVLAVALTRPTLAAENVPAKTAGTKARVEKGKPAKAGEKSPATTAPGSDAKKPAAAITATPAQLSAVMRAKRTFLYAADTCSRPEKCDPTLRDESKSTFMDACMACTSEELCEQERDAILGGTAKGSKNPCVP
jgi:hypothetical protein